MGVDRLSGLPVPILHHILSFLETKGVVQTCVLSKTWRNIWCSVPTLKFYFHHDHPDFVNSVLFQRDETNVEKLHLELPTGNRCHDTRKCLNNWIIYAMKHNIQHLLVIQSSSMANLTPRIFVCESLRVLDLHKCVITLPSSSTICLHALRILKLTSVSFKYSRMEEVLFSAIPSLETLRIDSCEFRGHKLTISSPQLVFLDIIGRCPSLVEISAPNLRYLDLNISNAETFKFNGDVLSIVSASITLPNPPFPETIIHLLRAVCNVKYLTLRCEFIQLFVFLQNNVSLLERLQTPFYNLQRLKMETSFSDGDVFVIHTLLKHAPQIKTIILKSQMTRHDENATGQLLQGEVPFVYELSHLKQVEIQEFRASENEMKLTKFFLENAVVLKKLIILTSNRYYSDEAKIKTGTKLIDCPRASSSVGILFS